MMESYFWAVGAARRGRGLAVAAVAAIMLLAGASAAGATELAPSGSTAMGIELAAAELAPIPAPPENGIRPMNDAEKQGTGCLMSAAAAMGITYTYWPNEVIMLVVGGVVIPSNSSILFLSLFGTVAAASCAVGAIMTPSLTWLYDRFGG